MFQDKLDTQIKAMRMPKKATTLLSKWAKSQGMTLEQLCRIELMKLAHSYDMKEKSGWDGPYKD